MDIQITYFGYPKYVNLDIYVKSTIKLINENIYKYIVFSFVKAINMSAQKTAQDLEIEQINAQLAIQLAELAILQSRQRLLLLTQQTVVDAPAPLATKQSDVKTSETQVSVTAPESTSDVPTSELSESEFPPLPVAVKAQVKKTKKKSFAAIAKDNLPVQSPEQSDRSLICISPSVSISESTQSKKDVEPADSFEVVQTKKTRKVKTPGCGFLECKEEGYHCHCCQLDYTYCDHACKRSVPLLWDEMPSEFTRTGSTVYTKICCPRRPDKIIGHARRCNTEECKNVVFTLNVPEWNVATHCKMCRKAYNSR